MAGWIAYIVDLKGAFLHGKFKDSEQIFMEVPKGFKCFYLPSIVLLLLQILYGLQQATMAFWRKLFQAMKLIKFKCCQADLCIYFKHITHGLVIWLSWIDNCFCIGAKEAVEDAKNKIMTHFDCNDVGFTDEYVGRKLDFDWFKNSFKFTQLQSFTDEFDVSIDEAVLITPIEPGRELVSGLDVDKVPAERATYFRSGVGKLLHMMR